MLLTVVSAGGYELQQFKPWPAFDNNMAVLDSNEEYNKGDAKAESDDNLLDVKLIPEQKCGVTELGKELSYIILMGASII